MSRAFLLLAFLSVAQSRSPIGEYALVLKDAPAAQTVQSRAELQGPTARAQAQRVRTAQTSIVSELQRRKVPVEWSGQLLANVVYVRTTRESAVQLAAIPGVARVVYLPPLKRDLTTALNLMNVQAAWNTLGGAGNAGAGMKIAIIDSGIDQNHPGFQDSSLKPPSGFPKGDTAYTNNKVIVARNFASADSSTTDPTISYPDDTTPRDRVGHGTAIAMIAAGVQNNSPLGPIQGVAPKAFLGNYKVFGSPGVNDFASYASVQQALEAALNDGMDVATLALSEGYADIWGPFQIGSDCGKSPGEPCEPYSIFVENASRAGLTIVTSAGNDGDIGTQPAALNTIHQPGNAPSAITVGASTNSHVLTQSVRVNGANISSDLQKLSATFGDGPRYGVGAPLKNVASQTNACAAYPAGSLAGVIVIVPRGDCDPSTNINNAQAAGAVGVILYQAVSERVPGTLTGVRNTAIPSVLLTNNDGTALSSAVASGSGATATLDPTFTVASATSNVVAPFSSHGPSTGTFAATRGLALKPELVAVGVGIYTATQKLDPSGDAYDPSGYTAVSGTSYAVGFVAGAVALVKQNNSAIATPAQLKSAVVNTATQDVTEAGATARVTAVGAGKLSVGDAVNAAATLEPATLSFGAISTTTVSSSLALKITNVSASTVQFNVAVNQRDPDSKAAVTVTQPRSLTRGASDTITVRLSGTRPDPGSYEGFIVITGAGPTLRIPYQYLVGTGVPADIFPVYNGNFIGGPGDTDWLTGFRLVDRYGVPVTGYPVGFSVVTGGGKITLGDFHTDILGDAFIVVTLGTQGDQVFRGTAGALGLNLTARLRPYPFIPNGGVVDAATQKAGQGLAPGSYISIYGTGLSDTTLPVPTLSLSVSLAGIAVSFDAGGLSLPGHLHFVGPGQVNVQIPWEFQGKSSVQMKVTVNYLSTSFYGNVYTVPLATYSPGIFASEGNAAVFDYTGGYIVANNKPAKRGDILEIFANGLGPVDNTPVSGEPTQGTTRTLTDATVTIGGVAAEVSFTGLTPGSVGLYQINATIPPNAPTGNQELVVSIGGVKSPPTNLPIQ